MGTLDDAIREHLELKKRSGAPEDEVQRLEHEAFGPVRRDPAASAPEAAPDVEVDDEAPPPQDEPAPPPEPAAVPDPDPEPVVEHPVVERPRPVAEESWLADDEVDEGPQPTQEFTAAEAAQAEGQPPSDYVAPDEEGEDLLEETPDFLQETPEHDRLWFEQRPPRDFDFDE